MPEQYLLLSKEEREAILENIAQEINVSAKINTKVLAWKEKIETVPG